MNTTVKKALLEGLKMYEASIKRMQTAKPQFAEMFIAELTSVAEARAWVMAQKEITR